MQERIIPPPNPLFNVLRHIPVGQSTVYKYPSLELNSMSHKNTKSSLLDCFRPYSPECSKENEANFGHTVLTCFNNKNRKNKQLLL